MTDVSAEHAAAVLDAPNLAYQMALRSPHDDPQPCRVCGKPTRGVVVVETGDVLPLCPPVHLTREHAAALVRSLEP